MRPRSGAQTICVLTLLLCFGAFLNCGGGSTAQVGGGSVTLTTITIAPSSPTISKGTSVQLSATGNYSNGTQKPLTASAAWQTSQPAIATVSNQGNVTGVSGGAAQVSASYEGVTGSTSVTVGPAALLGIAVSPNPSSLPVGESEPLTATGSFSDGTVQNLTQSVTWSSSASAVASVSPAGSVLANAAGTATIGATSGLMSGSASLTVTPAVVVALNIVPTPLSIVLESSRQLQAIATWSDGTTQDVTNVAAWSTTPEGIAIVSSGGLATAQQVGSTTILATDGGVSASANLTVVPLVFINYYDRGAAKTSGMDGTVNLTNPGLTNGSLCAMVYVFDQNQELTECCGCSVSDSGLRTLSLLNDLTANPLTGTKSTAGTVMVIPSDIGQNPQCDPGSLTPTGVILGWETNDQALPDGTFQVTETSFASAPLNSGTATNLANLCTFIENEGGGQGICTCGTGN